MKHGKHKMFPVGFVCTLIISLLLACSASGMASPGGEQSVTIEAEVAQRLVFSLTEGESVVLVADPIDQPTAEAKSSFQVKTNVSSYAISANFGAFEVGDSGYDLIGNENFKVKSVPPGDGDAIFDWTVPSEEMAVVSGENGFTNGETTVMEYQLNVDFSVPTGGAATTIVFTATASM